MAKHCPLLGERVLYTACLECEEKVCALYARTDAEPLEEPEKEDDNET